MSIKRKRDRQTTIDNTTRCDTSIKRKRLSIDTSSLVDFCSWHTLSESSVRILFNTIIGGQLNTTFARRITLECLFKKQDELKTGIRVADYIRWTTKSKSSSQYDGTNDDPKWDSTIYYRISTASRLIKSFFRNSIIKNSLNYSLKLKHTKYSGLHSLILTPNISTANDFIAATGHSSFLFCPSLLAKIAIWRNKQIIPNNTDINSIDYSPSSTGARIAGLLPTGGMIIDDLLDVPLRVSWSPDGKYLAIRYDNGVLKLWEPLTGDKYERFSIYRYDDEDCFQDIVWQPQPNNTTKDIMVTSGGYNHNTTVTIRNIRSGIITARQVMPGLTISYTYSTDGGIIYFVNDKGLYSCDADNLRLLSLECKFPKVPYPRGNIYATPDGNHLLIEDRFSTADKELHWLDFQPGINADSLRVRIRIVTIARHPLYKPIMKEMPPVDLHDAKSVVIGFIHSTNAIILGMGNSVFAMPVDSFLSNRLNQSNLLWQVPIDQVEAIDYCPKWNLLAAAGNGTLEIWDPQTMKRLLGIRNIQVDDLAFDKQGRYLCTTTEDEDNSTIRIWNTNRESPDFGKCLRVLCKKPTQDPFVGRPSNKDGLLEG